MKWWVRAQLFFALMVCSVAFSESKATRVSRAALEGDEVKKFTGFINQFREHLGLPVLEINSILTETAQLHSDWMASIDFLTHYGPSNHLTPFQRMKQAGYTSYTYAGENIACGFPDAKATFLQFARSPPHLKNMIHPHFHQMGVARSGTGEEHCPYYWTHDFGSITDPEFDSEGITDSTQIESAIKRVLGTAIETPGNPIQGHTDDGTETRVTPRGELDIMLIQCMISPEQ